MRMIVLWRAVRRAIISIAMVILGWILTVTVSKFQDTLKHSSLGHILLRRVLPCPSSSIRSIWGHCRRVVVRAPLLWRLSVGLGVTSTRIVVVVWLVRVHGIMSTAVAASRRHVVVDVRSRGVVRFSRPVPTPPLPMSSGGSRRRVPRRGPVIWVCARPISRSSVRCLAGLVRAGRWGCTAGRPVTATLFWGRASRRRWRG